MLRDRLADLLALLAVFPGPLDHGSTVLGPTILVTDVVRVGACQGDVCTP